MKMLGRLLYHTLLIFAVTFSATEVYGTIVGEDVTWAASLGTAGVAAGIFLAGILSLAIAALAVGTFQAVRQGDTYNENPGRS